MFFACAEALGDALSYITNRTNVLWPLVVPKRIKCRNTTYSSLSPHHQKPRKAGLLVINKDGMRPRNILEVFLRNAIHMVVVNSILVSNFTWEPPSGVSPPSNIL